MFNESVFFCIKMAYIGTKQELSLYTDVMSHYTMASEDLDVRRLGFDKMDVLFRSHIDPAKWPYKALIFDPRIFTSLFEKTARTFANKPKGRLIPREGGDILKAKINNELLSYQWDDNERADGTPMLAKWSLMDLNARKYGASFGLVKWKYQRNKKGKVVFDCPNFIPLNNRDCLANPSYSTVKNWFQHREYLTLQEMETVNDASRSKPIYKNLDLLKRGIREETKTGGDTRESNYQIKNKSLKGLTDYLGRDEMFKTVEVITEYRDDTWISFSPKHGIILREIDNPYEHSQIPIVQLKYYPIDDDLYGLSEIEPVESLQRALNAYLCQNIDTLNLSTYTPLKVRSTGGAVQMHTLEFGAGKKWMMSDPATDVLPFESNPQGVAEFVPVYRLISGAIQEALGETSIGTSNMDPGSANKTATEVRDLAAARSVRDNFNMIFLGEALKKQMNFWLTMNQQFYFSDPKMKNKIIRVVGKDALKYFQGEGLDGYALDDQAIDTLTSESMEGVNINPEDLATPAYPVETPEGIKPKMALDGNNQSAELYIEPEDLAGVYDYVPDIESMVYPDKGQQMNATQNMVELALNPQTTALLQADGYKLNVKELLEDLFEQYGAKDADKYFEKQEQLPVDPMQTNGQIDPTTGQPIQPGAGSPQAGGVGMVNGGAPGVQDPYAAMAGSQTQPVIS